MFKRWNPDMCYEFSFHKNGLGLFGAWPFPRNRVLANIIWIIGTILQMTAVFPAVLDSMKTHRNKEFALEGLVVVYSGFINLVKNIAFRVLAHNLRDNMDAANYDWYSTSKNQESYKIMKKYAKMGRFVTMLLFYLGNATIGSYIIVNIFAVQSILDQSKTQRTFVIYYSWLNMQITDVVYVLFLILQILQAIVICEKQAITDCFFFAIVIHVSGQFHVLRLEFNEFTKEIYTARHRGERLGKLVKKHCKLIALAKNIERTFSINILLQAFMSTTLIGIAGLRFLMSLKAMEGLALIKLFFLIVFFVIEILTYVYAGQILQDQSGGILFDLYNLNGERLPRKRVQDLTFLMARANQPVYLTGGKFFRISCKTFKSIIKAAFSYVSVLQVALNKLETDSLI